MRPATSETASEDAAPVFELLPLVVPPVLDASGAEPLRAPEPEAAAELTVRCDEDTE